MDSRCPEPRRMNFLATAELISQERDLIGRIDRLLENPFRMSLGEDRLQLLKVAFLHHMDLLDQAEEEWKLGPELLEQCLAHIEQVGFRHPYSRDLKLIHQAEETLSLIGEIDELLRPFAALEGEEHANTHDMDEADGLA